jgi:RNA polymerase sigma-70 factor (ECF subfamily)
MHQTRSLPVVSVDELPDAELVRLARQGDGSAFRVIMRRHNRRLYRVARSVLRDDSDAEDVLQEAYLRAFTGLADFRGEASLSSWLTRIALNEALGRRRRRQPTVDLAVVETLQERREPRILMFPPMNPESDPERAAARQDIRQLLERAIDELPEPFRIVFIMRVVEEMSIEETSKHLGLRPETVKTRLHRARRLLRRTLSEKLSSVFTDAFPFDGKRCARMADAVLARLGIPTRPPAT